MSDLEKKNESSAEKMAETLLTISFASAELSTFAEQVWVATKTAGLPYGDRELSKDLLSRLAVAQRRSMELTAALGGAVAALTAALKPQPAIDPSTLS